MTARYMGLLVDDSAAALVPITDYREIQRLVGGFFDVVTIDLGDAGRVDAFINDTGRLDGLPRNERATKVAHRYAAIFADDWLAGPVLIVGPPDAEGESTTLPVAALTEIMAVMVGPDLPPVRYAPTRMEAAAEAVFAGIPVILVPDPPDSPEDDPPETLTG